MSFESLPDEIILQIFGSLSLQQLQTKLRLVNRRWKRLADDDSHYRKLLLKSSIPSSMAIYLLQKYGSGVKHLRLHERRDINDLAPYIKECSNLKSLTLELCYGNGNDLIHALKHCRRLNTLTMCHCECVRNISNLLDMVAQYPIRKIILRSLQEFGNIEFWSLNNIEDFRLKYVSFNFLSIGYFCFNNCNTLTTLKLVPCNSDFFRCHSCRPENVGDIFNDVGDSAEQGVEWMLRFIGECQNLRSLCLGPLIARELNDDFIVHISRLNSLSTLILHQVNSVTDVAFTKLFQLPLANNLTKVNLHLCLWVTSSVLRTIASHCKNLEKFTFEKCKHTQTNQDHEDILVLAKSCTKLKTLRLIGMDICIAHVLHLLPDYLPDLMSLLYTNDSEPMNVPSFLPLLESKMPNFYISGLQWKFNLRVNCNRKLGSSKPLNPTREYVCHGSYI